MHTLILTPVWKANAFQLVLMITCYLWRIDTEQKDDYQVLTCIAMVDCVQYSEEFGQQLSKS